MKLTKKEIYRELKSLVKNKSWVKAVKSLDDDGFEFEGKTVEAYEVPLLLVEKLDDDRLYGYCERVWEDWASEAGDYEGAVWEIMKILEQ